MPLQITNCGKPSIAIQFFLMRALLIMLAYFFSSQITTNARQADSLILEAARKKLLNAKAYTLKVADLMPDSAYVFKPTSASMSCAEQLLHLSANMAWLSSSYLAREESPFKKEFAGLQTKDSILQVVSGIYDYSLKVLQNFDSRHLSDSVDFFAGPMNKLQIINLLNDHQTHHRAQMLVYLRLYGLKPPAYTGW